MRSEVELLRPVAVFWSKALSSCSDAPRRIIRFHSVHSEVGLIPFSTREISDMNKKKIQKC